MFPKFSGRQLDSITLSNQPKLNLFYKNVIVANIKTKTYRRPVMGRLSGEKKILGQSDETIFLLLQELTSRRLTKVKPKLFTRMLLLQISRLIITVFRQSETYQVTKSRKTEAVMEFSRLRPST